MKRLLAQALSLAFLLSIAVVSPLGCGHGGTEVGNPPAPQAPSDSEGGPVLHPSPPGPSPTPTPEANLNFDDMVEETEI